MAFNTFQEVDDYMAAEPEPIMCEQRVRTTDGAEIDISQLGGAGGDMTEISRDTTQIVTSDEGDELSITWHRIDQVEFENADGNKLRLIFDWPA